ncbi:MAG: pyridoxal-5'-phosphate-dependent protein subunit beta [Acidobacteria bacterium]|nr:pyridoxal-5'-phosphate-dependent protein subunit beta [Acidobacteriota bacterium]
MTQTGFDTTPVDAAVRRRAAERFRDKGITLPTFAQLAEPATIPPGIQRALEAVDPDAPHALNLFRVHWFNDASRRRQTAVPGHIVLPQALTGVRARIVVALGDRFPMIHAHKVLAAYGCLVPRIVRGHFDPTARRALWPSTGNYCRGGVAISRIMGCRGVAILPAGMSEERFRWLEEWVTAPGDIMRTPGTESNVKEIYDACRELSKDPANVVLNQFSEFGNYLAHWHVTGRAMERIVESMRAAEPNLSLAAFVSASGSAGTLAAGDYLKEFCGARVAAVEALECPTLLYNGFGEHNIQGIGDKHVPLIHNVMNTDVVAGVSDRATDSLELLFNEPAGREYLVRRRGVAPELVNRLSSLGLSSICNVVASIKVAKYFDLGPDDLVVTVATDGAMMYGTERQKAVKKHFGGTFDALAAGETFGEHLAGVSTDHLLELSARDRDRIFNLGYYTWVEQQGVSIEDFEARRSPAFWKRLRRTVPQWDEMIAEFNREVGVEAAI